MQIKYKLPLVLRARFSYREVCLTNVDLSCDDNPSHQLLI